MVKSWTNLLGTNTAKCKVDGRNICREVSPGRFIVIWQLDNEKQAQEALEAWIAEQK